MWRGGQKWRIFKLRKTRANGCDDKPSYKRENGYRVYKFGSTYFTYLLTKRETHNVAGDMNKFIDGKVTN